MFTLIILRIICNLFYHNFLGERKVNYQTVVITEVTDDLHIYGQSVDEGPKLEGLMTQLREEFTRSPPLAGAYTPRNGMYFKRI